MSGNRVDGAVLEYSQSTRVWRDWLPKLRYFTLFLHTAGESDRDRFRLSLQYNDPADAAGILRMLGVAARPGHLRFDLDSPVEGLVPNSQGWGVIAGRRVYVEVGESIDISVWQGLPAFRLTADDLATALGVEALVDRLSLGGTVLAEPPWFAEPRAVTRDRYPELFAG